MRIRRARRRRRNARAVPRAPRRASGPALTRIWIAAAAIGGFGAVAAGAVATHLAVAIGTAAVLLRTGALYGIVHAAALLAVAAIAEHRNRIGFALGAAGWSLAAGLLVFSFSLYALAATGRALFGLLTPFGGVALLVGWAALAVDALGRR